MGMLDQNPYLMAALLCVAGAVLGGALAHYRRGSGMIITGAIIGLAAGAVMNIITFYYAAMLAPLAILALVGFAALSWLFG